MSEVQYHANLLYIQIIVLHACVFHQVLQKFQLFKIVQSFVVHAAIYDGTTL